MPYRNIQWIKLEKRLLNDHRFYSLSLDSQRIYPKLLLLAAITNNKITKKSNFLRSSLRESITESRLEEVINEIRGNFPKLKEGKNIYFFAGFASRHNRVVLGSSLGQPQDALDKIRRDKDKNRIDTYLNHFRTKHKEITEVPYIPNYAKDRVLLRNLLEFEDKDALSLINEFFNSAGDSSVWWADKLSIGVFKTVIPQLIGRLRKR